MARAPELAPEEPAVILAAAELELDQPNPDLDTVRAALNRGLQHAPQDEQLLLALSELETRAGRPEAAEAWLRRGAEAAPENGASAAGTEGQDGPASGAE